MKINENENEMKNNRNIINIPNIPNNLENKLKNDKKDENVCLLIFIILYLFNIV